MKKITLALIGAGGIGKQWADAIKKTNHATLGLIVDVNVQGAKEIAAQFPNCIVSSDWHDAAKNKNIDAAIVATPHKWLAPISYGMLAAKKHVLCEKPCGIHPQEVGKNVAAAKKNKILYVPGFNHRYHPAYLEAHKIFEKGGIGTPTFIRARYGFGGRPGYNKEWRFKKSVAGGGELFDQGVHMIDMARWFMGDFKTIYGFTENMFWGGDVEDNGFVLMRTSKGQVAQIHVSWTNWDWVHSFELYGDKGYLIIDGLDKRYHGPERLVWGRRDKTFARPIEKRFEYANETKHDSLERELAAFIGAIGSRTHARTIPRGEDVYEAMKIVETIYQKNHGKR
jgi:predicted dehydrogenase